MKVLIAILSCHALRSYEQSLRDTWIKEIPEGIDYAFFLGAPAQVEDEVSLPVDDTWDGITKKAVAVYAWALAQGYDFVFKADLDTLVRPTLLLQCGFENHDYMGGRNHFFASGGAGYWLSATAMKAVVEHSISTGAEEDVHTASALGAKGIPLHSDDRFKYAPGDKMDDSTITFHISSVKGWNSKATPEEMYSVWKDQKDRNYRAYMAGVPAVRSLRLRRFQ